MRSTNDDTFNGSPAVGPAQSGGLLSPDELALPAVCGQTGKPFLMVVRRQVRGVLELIRAVVIDASPSVSGVPVRRADPPPWTQARVPSRATLSSGAGGGMPDDRDVSFQALTMSARVEIGSRYDGCPHCHAQGYFHCRKCGLFSCWNRHNQKPHFDHTDIWCVACQLWRCTSEKDADDDSLSELTGYATRENTVDLRSRIAPGSTRGGQIDRATSIRGYLKS
jgi:hypothetical protein